MTEGDAPASAGAGVTAAGAASATPRRARPRVRAARGLWHPGFAGSTSTIQGTGRLIAHAGSTVSFTARSVLSVAAQISGAVSIVSGAAVQIDNVLQMSQVCARGSPTRRRAGGSAHLLRCASLCTG